MVHFSEIAALRASLQFLSFSEAYLESARLLCDDLTKSPSKLNYPKGAVVLSLAFHGIELFLKAAILEKAPGEQFNGNVGHDLDILGKRYANLYPGKMHAFEIPFRNEEPDLVDPDPRFVAELKALMAKRKRFTPANQLHRYPRDIEGNPWEGIYAFEAMSFSLTIEKVQQDIAHLKGLIFHG